LCGISTELSCAIVCICYTFTLSVYHASSNFRG